MRFNKTEIGDTRFKSVSYLHCLPRVILLCVVFTLFFVAKKLSFSRKILYTHTQSFGDDRVITANGNKIRGVFIKISSEFLIENTLFFSYRYALHEAIS